jgi:hypothetical protein
MAVRYFSFFSLFPRPFATDTSFDSLRSGQSGTHIHMTNTKVRSALTDLCTVQTDLLSPRKQITDPEILEKRFPLLLRQFTIREGSGGKGKFVGGNGVHREFECLMPETHMMVIGERRVNAPYGLHGGENGERGASYWNKMMPDGTRRTIRLKPSGTIQYVSPSLLSAPLTNALNPRQPSTRRPPYHPHSRRRRLRRHRREGGGRRGEDERLQGRHRPASVYEGERKCCGVPDGGGDAVVGFSCTGFFVQ